MITGKELEKLKIIPPDAQIYAQVKASWDKIAKPLDGLGQFETMFAQIGAITGSSSLSIEKKVILTMCADNGIVAEGVSQSGQEVTAVVAGFMGQQASSVGKMARRAGVDVIPVDIGINTKKTLPGVRDCKVMQGTRDFLQEPAMTEEEALQALSVGIDLVRECKDKGYQLIGTGEMGIGNTTPAAAMSAVLTGLPPEEATGRGAGLSDAGLEKKKKAVEMAVSRFYGKYPEYRNGTKEQYERGELSAVTVLAELGGFDLAGMTGLFLGGAAAKIPVLMDGFLSTVSGLLAVLIRKEAKDYIFASHISTEPAGAAILQMLDLPAPLHMGMHLGEGSGAVAMIPLLRMGAKVYEEMSTFSDISVEQYVDYQEKGERP